MLNSAPIIGTIISGKEIGKKGHGRYYVYTPCASCGIERWVELKHGTPRNPVCLKCASKLRSTHGLACAKCKLPWNGYGSPATCPKCHTVSYAIIM